MFLIIVTCLRERVKSIGCHEKNNFNYVLLPIRIRLGR